MIRTSEKFKKVSLADDILGVFAIVIKYVINYYGFYKDFI